MGPGAGGKCRYILALAYGPNLGPLVSLSRTRLSLLLYVLVLSQRALFVHIVMSLSPCAVACALIACHWQRQYYYYDSIKVRPTSYVLLGAPSHGGGAVVRAGEALVEI